MAIQGFDELPRGTGVCRLVCGTTRRSFVFASLAQSDTARNYVQLLRRRRFWNSDLQSDFNRLGELNFRFEVLEQGFPREELQARHELWFDRYSRQERIYNRKRPARRSLELRHQDRRLRDWPRLRSPDGVIHEGIRNLREFCRGQGLSYLPIWAVSRGQQLTHRGWRVA